MVDSFTEGDEAAKRAYLVGKTPKGRVVHLLVKVHDFRGKAIYVYNLLNCTREQEADSHTPDIDARIERYCQATPKLTPQATLKLTPS